MSLDAEILPVGARPAWRYFARFVDMAILSWLTYFLLVEIRARLLGGDPWGRQPYEPDATAALLAVALGFAYEVGFVARFRGTPGKLLLGMRVVGREDLEPAGMIRSVTRWAVLYFPIVASLLWAPIGPPLLLVMWTVLAVSIWMLPDGQGLHDIAAATTVHEVRRDAD